MIFVNGLGWLDSDPRPDGCDLDGVVVGASIQVRDIVAATVRVFRYSEADLMGKSVAPGLVSVRWAMWLAACEVSRHSRSNVARRMNRDHSSLFHGVKKANRAMADRIKAEAVRGLG